MYEKGLRIFKIASGLIIFALISVFLLASSTLPPTDPTEKIRSFTRQNEFDYVSWTLDALGIKNAQSALNPTHYLPLEEQRKVVIDTLKLTRNINTLQDQIEQIYSDPQVKNPKTKAAAHLAQLANLQADQSHLQPLSESILQQQTSAVLADMGLSLGGQTTPPLLYHITPLPLALIVSPRDKIRQDANISLLPNLTLDQISALEKAVEEKMNVSALVVNIGGVGVYPTMVMSTTDLPWLTEVIAHEWTHNYLTLRPLGINYETSPELRTMNETTASIVGKEVSREVLKRFFPEYLPAEPSTAPAPQPGIGENKPPEFDFRKEMHQTRVTVDKLLADGKVDEAEQYMEQRRQVFWDHGYTIRRLNQAYFAFNGAYADEPGGAAGQDPVGPAVRTLRQQSKSLADFLNRMSWMASFSDLQKAIQSP